MLKTNNTQGRDNLSCIRANIHTFLERPNINPLYDRQCSVPRWENLDEIYTLEHARNLLCIVLGKAILKVWSCWRSSTVQRAFLK